MSQKSKMAARDRAALAKALKAGNADSAIYYRKADAPTSANPVGPIMVMVNRDALELQGDQTRMSGTEITVRAMLADLPEIPKQGAAFDILDDEGAVETRLRVRAEIDRDESLITLACVEG